MEIKLFNTLNQRTEDFKPLKKGKVSMYHCGPTVYSKPHIGNYRPYIIADLMRRVFEVNGYKVKQVINITDVGHLVSDNDFGEDKIEKESKKRGQKAKEITKEITNIFFEDLKKLNIDIKKIKFPRATDYIKEQIKLIKKLEEKGYTYKISDGIYFDTSKFSDYGVLGNIDLENIHEGIRVEFNNEKRNKTDFALWKFSNQDEKREQEWNSPWGVGFPGWHIECSAMSRQLLGQPFDIHTGGVDHINIHHNNEIAQSKCAFENDLSNYWIHINHILIDNQKISKSLGHTLFLEDFKNENILIESYKYWVLSGHYSSLLNFNLDSVRASDTAIKKIIKTFKNIKVGKVNKKYFEKAKFDVNNNLNSAKVIATIWEMIKDDSMNISDKKATLFELDKILGIGFINLIKNAEKIKIPKQIIELGKERQVARKNKNYLKSDELRAKINDLGYLILDEVDDEFEILPK